jgi:hypothetical protein
MAGEPVKLNIYDVSTNPTVGKINEALSAVGTGAFHGGVEVYGEEYSYGFIKDGTGVFGNAPKGCTMHHFRETIEVGTTTKTKEEMLKVIEEMKEAWPGKDYDLLRRNCVLFSKEFVDKLGAGPVPPWVTNLAGAGATVQDGLMQAATQAQAMAILAKAKAGEMDAQYNIKGTAKAKLADLIQATKALDEQHQLKDKATKAADAGAAAMQQGIELVIMKASEADGRTTLLTRQRTNSTNLIKSINSQIRLSKLRIRPRLLPLRVKEL